MITKKIKYTDFDGNEREETFYFNLTKAECIEMQLSEAGGLHSALTKMIERQNAKKTIAFFKGFIFKAYGEKSADGRRFIKSQELSDNFSQTEAYSELFQELVYNAKAAAEFVNEIIPKNLAPEFVNEIIPKNLVPEDVIAPSISVSNT